MKKYDADEYAKNTVAVSKMRGSIIHLMVDMEHHFDNIIAFVYCGENATKREEFIHAILGKECFGLRAKEEVVSFIIKRHHPKFYDDNKDIIDNLSKLVSKRNKYAHHKFIHNATDKTDEWVLLNPTTSVGNIKLNITPISQDAFTGDLHDIESALNTIFEFINLLGLRTS